MQPVIYPVPKDINAINQNVRLTVQLRVEMESDEIRTKYLSQSDVTWIPAEEIAGGQSRGEVLGDVHDDLL